MYQVSIKQLWQDFIYLLQPQFCLACFADLLTQETYICTRCQYTLPKTQTHLNQQNTLSQKFWGKVDLQYVLAYLKFAKGGQVQRLLHHLKYKNKPELAYILGLWYGQILKQSKVAYGFEMILPIPLHQKKLKQRGYNQSDGFAKGLSEAMNVPWSPKLLIRQKATSTQTKKGRYERWQNVANIFAIESVNELKNKHILLVDDVITTGSTLEACSALLLKHTNKVSVAAIAAAELV